MTLVPVCIVGPTAAGKTDLALALARRLGGEVVSADMGQLYRRLDAGTAKPPGRWEGDVYKVEGVPYHLVDVLDPAEPTDAGRFAALARPVLEAVRGRGRRAVVAGGTGLYLRALFEGLDPLPRGDAALRTRLRRRLESEGPLRLHAELAARDPAAARAIPAGNAQRLLRALEVLDLTGRPISEQWTRKSGGRPGRAALYVGLRRPPESLRERIRRRAEAMFPAMLREVSALVPAVYTGAEPAFRCLGYPEALACARGELSTAEGLERMIAATWAYARRQRTWFSRQVDAAWLDAEGKAPEELAREAESLLGGEGAA